MRPDPERGWALAAMTGNLSFREAKPAMIRGLVEARVDPVLFRALATIMWAISPRPPR